MSVLFEVQPSYVRCLADSASLFGCATERTETIASRGRPHGSVQTRPCGIPYTGL